ncbi:MAG: hydantoinase/oxoprolinase family protein [Chloroflexota bacterium]
MAIRLATDIGGTFTDLVAFDEASGQVHLGKASSTPSDFSQGILDAVDVSAIQVADAAYFVHGCTVVINAITERKGVKTALVTTAGFRDVLEIGRGNRPDMYNLRFQKPIPFVPRHLRFEVRERVDRHGTILTPLHLEDLSSIVAHCQSEGVEAIAVCFLHAYAHPEHEQKVAAQLREALPDVAVTVSSDITQEWREYERTNTTVLNGYVMPIVQGYLDRLEAATSKRNMACPLHVMQSNGGTAPFSLAKRLPIYLIESGPVAGVMGAATIGQAIDEPNVISFDVGGTTAKCSLVEGGEPKTTTEYRLEWTPLTCGYPVKTPVVDIVEIGAGGGSIAWFDEGDVLRVGPKSAGADPGPACYGQGGKDPTVTDAKLVAGVINPDYFLGGNLTVYPELARQALAPIAAKLNTTVEQAANGIIRMVNASMTEALKLITVQRGYDPRDFALVACGGGGAMHAAALAQELQMKKVIIPPHPGHFSAWGMLVTQPRIDLVRTHVYRTTELTPALVDDHFTTLETAVHDRFAADGEAGIISFQCSADLRYHGQEHTVPVIVDRDNPDLEQIERDFHLAHEKLYTFQLTDTPIELVNFHVAGFREVRRPEIKEMTKSGQEPSPEIRTRRVDFDIDGVHDTKIYQRDHLQSGFSATGPLIVEESASTTLVHPGQSLEVDIYGNLIIHFGNHH